MKQLATLEAVDSLWGIGCRNIGELGPCHLASVDSLGVHLPSSDDGRMREIRRELEVAE
jgi:hypothetical protein